MDLEIKETCYTALMLETIMSNYQEYWTIFLTAIPKIIMIIVIGFVVAKVGKKILEKIIRRAIKGEPDLDEKAELKREETLIAILGGTFNIVLWLVILLLILSELSINIAPIIASAGVIGIAVGFGGQYLIRDIITGIFILLENQYRVGDTVDINQFVGKVEQITLRKTTLRDVDGNVHHIPHGEVTMVTNKSAKFSQVNIDFGIAYESDIDVAIEMINRVGEELYSDDTWSRDLLEAPYFKRVQDLGNSAVILKIFAKTKAGRQFDVAGELRLRLKKMADIAGISIPYPQMMVHQAPKPTARKKK